MPASCRASPGPGLEFSRFPAVPSVALLDPSAGISPERWQIPFQHFGMDPSSLLATPHPTLSCSQLFGINPKFLPPYQ